MDLHKFAAIYDRLNDVVLTEVFRKDDQFSHSAAKCNSGFPSTACPLVRLIWH